MCHLFVIRTPVAHTTSGLLSLERLSSMSNVVKVVSDFENKHGKKKNKIVKPYTRFQSQGHLKHGLLL